MSANQCSLFRPSALLLDGMSRAALFPFGPSLVARLVLQGDAITKLKPEHCAVIAFPFIAVVASYALGRFLGNRVIPSTSMSSSVNLSVWVPRLAGIIIALHVLTFGAGLSSVWWLAMIRFLSAFCVGILCRITADVEDKPKSDEEYEMEYYSMRNVAIGDSNDDQFDSSAEYNINNTTPQPKYANVDTSPETAKIYLSAFAVSILTGGLLFRHLATNEVFQHITGQYVFSTILFLLVIAVAFECILRLFFSSCARKQQQKQEQQQQQTKVKTTFDFKSMRRPSRQRLDSIASFKSAATPSRERTLTTDSEFFDCNSVLSGMEDIDDFFESNDDDDDNDKNDSDNKDRTSEIVQYQNGQCVYKDGTPAYIPAGDSVDTVPENYLKICSNNQQKAQRMWQSTQKWRQESKVWKIHRMPNRWYHEIKKAYPHTVHGFSKAGYPVIYERPGKMNLKELFQGGCQIRDMTNHLVFFMEFIAHRIVLQKQQKQQQPHTSSSWGTMVVMDVSGVGISHLSGDVVKYLKEAGDINTNYYPLTMRRAFLINSPFWLAGTWSTVKHILPDSVQVDILSPQKYKAALLEYIDDDQIPPEYGGSSPYKLGEHPMELELEDLVKEVNALDDDDEDDDDDILNYPTQWNDPTPSNSSLAPLRRRAGSTSATTAMMMMEEGTATTTTKPSTQKSSSSSTPVTSNTTTASSATTENKEIHIIVSVMYTLFHIAQGIIETAIPLWIVTPTVYGGLGYAPSRSGVTMFCSAMVLLWVMRTKWSRVILPQIPIQHPMRSFRIGVGSQSALLMLMAWVPSSLVDEPSKRTDSILLMAFTVIMISCLILSSIFGRNSSAILHQIAGKTTPTATSSHASSSSSYNLFYLTGELLGIIIVYGMIPNNMIWCMYISCWITLVLYIGSFSLNFKNGDFQPHDENDGELHNTKQKFVLYEVFMVSLNDMLSLFDNNSMLFNYHDGHQQKQKYSNIAKIV